MELEKLLARSETRLRNIKKENGTRYNLGRISELEITIEIVKSLLNHSSLQLKSKEKPHFETWVKDLFMGNGKDYLNKKSYKHYTKDQIIGIYEMMFN